MFITLIGYRGTGKSTLAPRLASRLNFDWVDADIELETEANRTIREIFDTDGEPEFRRLERNVLIRLLKRDRLVLAAGGGAILNESTRREIREAGPVIWLQASVDTIAERILRGGQGNSQRPNLTSTGGFDEIRDLLASREPLYRECATITVTNDGRLIEALVEQICSQLPSEYRQEIRS
jgi:shikimate kinase